MALDDITATRTLIGDPAGASQQYSNDEIAFFNSLAGVSGPGAEYFYAASLALSGLASRASSGLTEVRIGDYMDSSGRNKVTALNAAAASFLKYYYELPAFAFVEVNYSDMSALEIIRNYVLRTNP